MRKKENLWTLDQAAALAALAETYGAPCRTLAQNFLGDAYEAETCFQDACRQVWQAGQGQGDLLSALLRATRRLAWQRAPEGGRPDALIQELDRALPRREAPALPGGEGTAVWAAFFRGLLPESRRLFLRRYFFGDGIGPLAVAARQNEVAVHDQLSHLRQQLVQRLEEAGALPPDGAALFAALEGVEDPWLREAAGVRTQSRRRWLPALIGGGAGVALIAAILLFVPWDTPAAQGMAGEPGVLQDGAYYVYVGSGFALPNQNRTPEGIFRYIPGQGAEELVSCADHPIVTGANYGWDVNSHGLYYIDRETGQLFRQDLESGAETLLYTIPDEDFYLPEDQLDEGDLWDYYVHGETPEVLIPAAIRFQEVTEDQVVLTYRHTDGASNDTLVLDSRTGEELSRTPDPDPREGWTTRLGDRVIETVVMPHTEGFTYPGWEDDAETNAYRWTDIRENGVSLLPPGTMEGQSDTAQDFRGGLLIGYCPRETLDEQGNYVRYATGYLLLTPEGGTYDLPAGAEEDLRTYHAAAGEWVYFTQRAWEDRDAGGRRMTHPLWARNLHTGEEVQVAPDVPGDQVVTDGAWVYCSDGTTTDCYSLTTDDQGRPTGLTLVEEGL